MVISTPVAIAAIILVGGLALLPLIHVLWKSKAKDGDSNSLLNRLTAKWRRPTVLDSDAFIHKRDLDKLTKIVSEIQSLDVDRFSGHEFVSFIKLKSQIKTEEGQLALQSYVSELINISKHNLGLAFLAKLKTYQIGEYSILRGISSTIFYEKYQEVMKSTDKNTESAADKVLALA